MARGVLLMCGPRAVVGRSAPGRLPNSYTRRRDASPRYARRGRRDDRPCRPRNGPGPALEAVAAWLRVSGVALEGLGRATRSDVPEDHFLAVVPGGERSSIGAESADAEAGVLAGEARWIHPGPAPASVRTRPERRSSRRRLPSTSSMASMLPSALIPVVSAPTGQRRTTRSVFVSTAYVTLTTSPPRTATWWALRAYRRQRRDRDERGLRHPERCAARRQRSAGRLVVALGERLFPLRAAELARRHRAGLPGP
jgi:hypothetical protein